MQYPKCCFDKFIDTEVDLEARGVLRMAALTAKMWEPGQTVTYFFMGGVSTQHEEARAAFETWMDHANINFVEVYNVRESMVRISFDPRLGAWSYIGKDCLGIPKNKATMNLGFNQAGTYLHEIGHCLSLIHEHSHPEGGINWNVEAVTRALSGPPNNWNRQTIHNNMFAKYSKTQTNFSDFDPKSIMMYAFPNEWTIGDFETHQNAVLSPMDIAHIKKLYPSKESGAPGENNCDPAICPQIITEVVTFVDEVGRTEEFNTELHRIVKAERGRNGVGELLEWIKTIRLILTPENLKIIQSLLECGNNLTRPERAQAIEAVLLGAYERQQKSLSLARGAM